MKTPKPDQVMRAAAKVKSYRATEAGTVKVAYQATAAVVKLLADAHAEADAGLRNEIKLLLAGIQRFSRHAHAHLQAKTGALHVALAELERVEGLLKRAAGPGYGVVAMAQRAQADTNRVRALKASLQLRAREMAFVLAELEQMVDPLPGLRIASASTRKKNDKLRSQSSKTPAPQGPVGVVGNPGATTSSYGVPAHASEAKDPQPEGPNPERV